MAELAGKQGGDVTDVAVGKLVPCEACCCMIASLYPKWPDCCGCKYEEQCCCFSTECAGCKPVTKDNDDGKCCVLYESSANCVKLKCPLPICMGSAQIFCCEQRCALPCNKEKVPCVVNFCGATFCVDMQCVGTMCCKDLETLVAAADAKRGKVKEAPEQQEMSGVVAGS